MAYDYVRRTYGFDAKVGQRVRHTVIKKEGVITRENPSEGNYVRVMFDGRGFSVPCHPGELEHVNAHSETPRSAS